MCFRPFVLSTGYKIPDKTGVIAVKIIYVDIGVMAWRILDSEVDPLVNTLKTILLLLLLLLLLLWRN
jgi:hypothetical protein